MADRFPSLTALKENDSFPQLRCSIYLESDTCGGIFPHQQHQSSSINTRHTRKHTMTHMRYKKKNKNTHTPLPREWVETGNTLKQLALRDSQQGFYCTWRKRGNTHTCTNTHSSELSQEVSLNALFNLLHVCAQSPQKSSSGGERYETSYL